jgi:spectinomycin phosphotransferase
MLEKPDIQDEKIAECIQVEYGLNIVQIAFLPLGADQDTAVYRAVTDDETPYFVKLRSGVFDEMTIMVPKLLHDQGIQQVIAPLSTLSQQLWADLSEFKLTVFPFIEGHNGYEVDMLDRHWVDFGSALKSIHTAAMPATVLDRIQREAFSPQWRNMVRHFQDDVENIAYSDPVAAELATFLKSKRDVISELVRRAEHLASIHQAQSLPLILCHADIHAGNLLITADGTLYVVDWDTLTVAPKERDLMFIGGGHFLDKHSPQEEEELFYRGYGQTQCDPIALAYYRYERIVQDIAAYCEQILLTEEGGEDRMEGLRQLTGQFLPNQVVEVAFMSEHKLPRELQSKSLR